MTALAYRATVVGREPMAGMPSALPSPQVRAATPADRAAVVAMLRGLVAALPVPWRHPQRLRASCRAVVEGILQGGRDDAALFVAHHGDGMPVGVALALPCCATSRGPRAVVVLVAGDDDPPSARALEAAAQAWAQARGCVAWNVDAFVASHPASSLAPRTTTLPEERSR